MKNQSTFSDIEYQNRKHSTPKEEFLDAMNAIVPWDRWIKLIEPYYPKGKRGRPTRGIETMLRMYLLQDWFNNTLNNQCNPLTAVRGLFGRCVQLRTRNSEEKTPETSELCTATCKQPAFAVR